MVEAPDDVHEGALAGAARAHERHQLAPRNLKRHALEHGRIHLAQVVGLVNVPQVDGLVQIYHPPSCYRPLPEGGVACPWFPSVCP